MLSTYYKSMQILNNLINWCNMGRNQKLCLLSQGEGEITKINRTIDGQINNAAKTNVLDNGI